jgi:hypothetical protein
LKKYLVSFITTFFLDSSDRGSLINASTKPTQQDREQEALEKVRQKLEDEFMKFTKLNQQ